MEIKTEEFVFARTDELKLLGRHNHENVMASFRYGILRRCSKGNYRE